MGTDRNTRYGAFRFRCVSSLTRFDGRSGPELDARRRLSAEPRHQPRLSPHRELVLMDNGEHTGRAHSGERHPCTLDHRHGRSLRCRAISTGSVSLVLIVETGFSTSQTTSRVTPAFSGNVGVAFRLGNSNTYIMPYAKAANAAVSSTGGSLATAVFQPGVMLLYGFKGK